MELEDVRFIELFAGIGGFRYGLEACNRKQQGDAEAGRRGDSVGDKGEQSDKSEEWGDYTCVWGNEWDKYAARLYRQNYGGDTESGGRGTECVGVRPRGNKSGIEVGGDGEPEARWDRFEQQSEDNSEEAQGERDEESRGDVSYADGEPRALRGGEPALGDGWDELSGLYQGDIRTIDVSGIPDHELLCAGFPCQSFSIAGKRQGFEDIRGTLFFEICRVIRAKRPRLLLLENVKGLLSAPYTFGTEIWEDSDFDPETGELSARGRARHNIIQGTKGFVFATILQVLDELGYDCQWEVLNSKNFGVPQNRERVFIIGHLRGTPRPKVFPLGETGEGSDRGDAEITNALQSPGHACGNYRGMTMIRTRSDQAYAAKDTTPPLRQSDKAEVRVVQPEPMIADFRGDEGLRIRKNNLSPTLKRRAESEDIYNVPLVVDDFTPAVAVSPVLTPEREQRRQRGRRMKEDGDPMFTLTGQDVHGIEIANTLDADGYLRTGERPRDEQGKPQLLPIGYRRIRRLTPKECARLQGFPDYWHEGVSDTQAYKCYGNAVTTKVITAIGKRLKGVG